VPWQELTLSSQALAGNALGDPHERPLFVWAPADTSRRYPSVYVLHAHMRSARSWFNVTPFETSYPDAVEALQPDAVVVLVDGWTSVGGSQWIDSAGIGSYGTYLCEEVVPFVDERFPTLAEPARRALQGKSSGGYGALVTAVARPDLFSAVAAHAPDALFDVTVSRGFAPAARVLRDRHDGSPARFWESFTGLRSDDDALLVELLSSALVYSDGELPFSVADGTIVPDVWARWLERDPVRLIAEQWEAACELGGVWLDAGNADEYFLDLGAAALRRALEDAGVSEERVHFELYEGRHGGASHRYPLSLAWLLRGLSSNLWSGSAKPNLR
jgi:S-formylglutathione hydrolase FrmB